MQTKCLVKKFEEKLGAKVLFVLIVTKINDSTAFKDRDSIKKKAFILRNKGKNMGVYAETIIS